MREVADVVMPRMVERPEEVMLVTGSHLSWGIVMGEVWKLLVLVR